MVDSSVLIDVLTGDARWYEWSSSALEAVMNDSAVVINPIIYAEAATNYKRVAELDLRLPTDLYRRDPLPYEAAFLAARAFVKYRRQGRSRTSPMPAFYIGAHAQTADFRVLTRDPRRFRRYFPSVELISPVT